MVSWLLSALLATAIAGQADCTIVYFGAPGCQPCAQISPALVQLKEEGWDIRTVDAYQHPKLTQEYQIQNLPTLVIVSNQREVDRIVGAVPYDQLASRFARAAARMQSSPLLAAQPLSARTDEGPIVRGQSPSVGGFPMLASSAAAQVVSAAATLQAENNLETTQPTADQPLAAASSPQPSLSVDQAIARAAAATVRIKVDEANTTAYGTGTIIDVHGSEALVLTCGHLFRDMRPGSQLSLDLFAGTAQELNVVAQLIDFKAEGEDIGLLTFGLPVAIEPVDILPRGEELQVGQPAFSFGCDHGQDPTRRDTRIRSIDRYVGAANVEIAGAPAVGRSGGGLFDLQGRLIGVCNAADATDDEGIYAAAEVVYTQIERLGLNQLFDTSPNTRPAGTVQLASSQTAPLQPAVQTAEFTQPANFTQPTASPAPNVNDGVEWPDQLAAAAAQGPAPANSNFQDNRQAYGSSPQEIICILRDQAGQSRVVTISGPAPELLQAIEQHAAH